MLRRTDWAIKCRELAWLHRLDILIEELAEVFALVDPATLDAILAAGETHISKGHVFKRHIVAYRRDFPRGVSCVTGISGSKGPGGLAALRGPVGTGRACEYVPVDQALVLGALGCAQICAAAFLPPDPCQRTYYRPGDWPSSTLWVETTLNDLS